MLNKKIDRFKKKIFDHWLETREFYLLLDKYFELITSCDLDGVSIEFKEFFSTMMPLRTFLMNNDSDYINVWLSSKNSIRDRAKIDAEVWDGNKIDRIQVTMATDNNYDMKDYLKKMEEIYFCDPSELSSCFPKLEKQDIDYKISEIKNALDRKIPDGNKYDILLIGLMDYDLDREISDKLEAAIDDFAKDYFKDNHSCNQIFVVGITRKFYKQML